ncbi:type I polyketide synthase [Streptomyces hygroscopicus]|uniref:type I polyketide synthase n=1 Tax=Streptomyces hygroscopicus TaxID=1912 RepID=UPI00223FAF3D|nr:beta-ketoacyl synthase N-terminal-like domain-containing protein [Streptomyces hygroscopicus]
MAGRFPGAANVEQFWTNLTNGTDSVTRFAESSERSRGHVPAMGLLEDAVAFDAEFFGYSPRDARVLDPQHRVFLECAWESLEDAGYDPMSCPGEVGIYAGSSQTSYLEELFAHREQLGSVTDWQLKVGCGPDFLTSRVAYKLGLRGPAVTVQTACSTSLVAIHSAARAVLSGECDIALAGGVSIPYPPRLGEYVEGGIISPDGYCRTFDAAARGTVGGSAVGVVVLKRLTEAVAAGDRIRAVVRGTAVNNDGLARIGYTAPGLEGQARVIQAALTVAEVPPESVTYVEAHGTGTAAGDPIEVAALTRAFRAGTDARGFCRIGSVKTNIGHADAASGVVGFIKAVLAVERGVIPPSLHYSEPNPEIDFETGPFTVNTESIPWNPAPWPRRAGVSSFGIGGTNAHVVLEQPPYRPAPSAEPAPHLLVLSTRRAQELDAASARLAAHVRDHPDDALADIAWTLQTGRRPFPYRRTVVVTDHEDAVRALMACGTDGRPAEPGAPPPASAPASKRAVAFMFSGHGGQYAGMGRDLYESQPVFREAVDRCVALLSPGLGPVVRAVIRPQGPAQEEAAGQQLRGMEVAQVAIFVLQYATACLWRHWGVEPAAVTGHSLGTFAAACIAEVLSLRDALHLVTVRGRLMQSLSGDAMLAVPCEERDVEPLLGAQLDLVAVNDPAQCVVSGPQSEIGLLRDRLADERVEIQQLHIGAAAHSRAIEGILAEFAAEAARVSFKPPVVPWVSDTTGTWVPTDVAPTVDFWVEHMRRTVRFGKVLTTLFHDPGRVLVEIGPGRALKGVAQRHPQRADQHVVISSLPHSSDPASPTAAMLDAAGTLWSAGINISWSHLHDGHEHCRVGLPTYPFTRRRYAPDLPSLPDPSDVQPGDRLPAHAPTAASANASAPTHEEPGLDVTAVGMVTRRLVKTFGVVLGMEDVHPEENLFELGGDSLVALELTRAIRDELGVRVTTRQVFSTPTPSRLAAVIVAAAEAAVVVACVSPQPRGEALTVEEFARPPENRPPENRPPENRPPENRPPENRSPENRSLESRAVGGLDAEDRGAENPDAENEEQGRQWA